MFILYHIPQTLPNVSSGLYHKSHTPYIIRMWHVLVYLFTHRETREIERVCVCVRAHACFPLARYSVLCLSIRFSTLAPGTDLSIRWFVFCVFLGCSGLRWSTSRRHATGLWQTYPIKSSWSLWPRSSTPKLARTPSWTQTDQLRTSSVLDATDSTGVSLLELVILSVGWQRLDE